MVTGGDPQANQINSMCEDDVCTALWGSLRRAQSRRVSPEGLSYFQRRRAGSLLSPEQAGQSGTWILIEVERG